MQAERSDPFAAWQPALSYPELYPASHPGLYPATTRVPAASNPGLYPATTRFPAATHATNRMAYMSNKERNRHKHAENGNTPKKTQEQIQHEFQECLAWIRNKQTSP